MSNNLQPQYSLWPITDCLGREIWHPSRVLSSFRKLLACKDCELNEHGDRVLQTVTIIGKKIGLKPKEMATLRIFSQCHDLGKIYIPDSILLKKDSFSEKERSVMEMHSEIGARLALSVKGISHISDYILMHHENWDGSGYPLGVKGQDIPLFCRILSVADAWDAMINDRPYRKAMSWLDATEELEKKAGSQFDPEIVDIWRES